MKLPEILFENDQFVVLNKPSGLLSVPDRMGKEISLKALLQEKYGTIFTVHRLDRDTSGVIIYAKTEASHKHLSQQFEDRKTIKLYCGLVLGSPADKKGTIELLIAEHPVKKGTMVVHRDGKVSITDYEVLEDFRTYSWLQFRIHTGRTHQIRVHMKEIGHPMVCDEIYGNGKPVLLSSIKRRFKLSKDEDEERPLLNRLALHALRLELTDTSGKSFSFEATPPKDLRALLQQLEKWKK